METESENDKGRGYKRELWHKLPDKAADRETASHLSFWEKQQRMGGGQSKLESTVSKLASAVSKLESTASNLELTASKPDPPSRPGEIRQC